MMRATTILMILFNSIWYSVDAYANLKYGFSAGCQTFLHGLMINGRAEMGFFTDSRKWQWDAEIAYAKTLINGETFDRKTSFTSGGIHAIYGPFVFIKGSIRPYLLFGLSILSRIDGTAFGQPVPIPELAIGCDYRLFGRNLIGIKVLSEFEIIGVFLTFARENKEPNQIK